MGAAASHRGESEQASGDREREQEATEIGYKQFVERNKYGMVDVVVSSQSSRRAGNIYIIYIYIYDIVSRTII